MQKIGWVLGVGLFSLFLCWSQVPEALPQGMTVSMMKILAVTSLMACFWITEVIPIPATSLIPLALIPLLGVEIFDSEGNMSALSTKAIAPAYGDRMIILLMGGFFIATVIEKVNLHKRIALNVILKVGTNPRQLLLGFMIATAFLSMWISNTATTLMLLPIVLAVVAELEKKFPKEELATAFLLGIAYSASVGGVGTPIGTPPNLIMLSQYNETRLANPHLGLEEISFASWMGVGIPLVIVMILVMWVYMAFIRYKFPGGKSEAGGEIIKKELEELGKMSKPEKITLVLFAITAALWIFRKNINLEFVVIPGWSNLMGLEKFVDDATVAILMALIMFSYPLGNGKKLLDWNTAKKIPWGMLLLFGGGIALAVAFRETQLSEWLGKVLENQIQGVSPLLMLAIVCCFMTFLTEITSNTAVTTVMMPILAITAISIKVHPAFLMMPAAISASFAFMLPVATAPNAIMYGTERFTIAQMAKTGFLLNLVGVGIIASLCYVLGYIFIF